MKRLFLTGALIAIAVNLLCQAPMAFNYQAILRNSDGTLMSNEDVSLEISIVPTSGPPVYIEMHRTMTNEFGLVNLEIGEGATSGDLSSVDWSAGPFFLDITVNGVSIGSSPILSVPYALYAASGNPGPPGPQGFQGEIGPQGTQGDPGVAFDDTQTLSDKSWTSGKIAKELENKSDISHIHDFATDANGNVITNLADPTNPQDAATKIYIDAILYSSGLIPKNYHGLVYDIDDNAYKSIKLGDQIWFAENLKVTNLNDGTPIPGVSDKIEWSNLKTPGFCWYNNDSIAYHDPYGALYNWFTVETGKLCPTGWHVPGDLEWQILIDFLGGESEAGGKLKEAGKLHWATPNEGASNETGFTALPGGNRFYNGSFHGLETQSFWWSSTENGICCGFNLYLLNDAESAKRYDSDKEAALSVRCVKDAP